jgi:hypothetical protein
MEMFTTLLAGLIHIPAAQAQFVHYVEWTVRIRLMANTRIKVVQHNV